MNPIKHRLRSGAVCAALVGLGALGAAGPAAAAAAATATSSTQLSIVGGALNWSTAPTTPALSSLTLNGTAQTQQATMGTFSVVDATGLGAGWNVTVQGNTGTGLSPVFAQYCPTTTCGSDTLGYKSGGHTFAVDSLTLNSTGATAPAGQGGTTGTPPTYSCGSGCPVDTPAASPSKIVDAALGAGMGTYQLGPFSASSLSVAVPTTTYALSNGEYYKLDLLWSLNTGP